MITDNEGIATFNGKKWQTSAGFVRAPTLKDSHIS